MPDIVLTTLNAKYIHAAFGLRYLLANLGALRSQAGIAEFDINQRPLDIAEGLLARNPKIIGFGIYLWNVTESTEVIAAIKRVRPDITVILGGPEVSYEMDQPAMVQLADFVITGEADLKFAEVCCQLISGDRPKAKIIPSALPEFSQLVLPYELYTDDDVAHRVIYVEASRGCPFTCEFCLSSLDVPVRQAPLPQLLEQFQMLLDRGVRHFKFVDRTFNLNVQTSQTILQFFLERYRPGHFYHFEMIPDRLPESLRERIAQFPPGALQFEVGVQSFNEATCKLISRRQDVRRLEENFHFLCQHTGVHVHADLIVGLPGETIESFAAGFDRLIALNPQEIQVGILKRLRGTPIVRHDAEWQMIYNPHPPYDLLQNKLVDFATMQRMRRFARYWDLVGNSGNFVETARLLWSNPGRASPLPQLPGTSDSLTNDQQANPAARLFEAVETFARPSPFAAFLRWSEWLYAHAGRTHGIALSTLAELLFRFLTTERGLGPVSTAETLWRDYQRGGRRDRPQFLRKYLPDDDPSEPPHAQTSFRMKRQARHRGTPGSANAMRRDIAPVPN